MRRLFIFIVAIILFCPSYAHAQAASPVANFLVQAGKGYYEAGDYVGAIHEFSKALMVDPYNEEAQKYLKFLGAEGGLYARPDSEASAVVKLGQQIDRYRGEVINLKKEKEHQVKVNQGIQQENHRLSSSLVSIRQENAQLLQKVQDVQIEAADQKELAAVKINALKDSAKVKSLEIARLSLDNVQLQNNFSEQVSLIAQKDGEIKGLNDRYREAVEQSQREASDRDDQLRVADKRIKEKTDEIAKLNTNLHHFKNKYSVRAQRLGETSEKLKEADRQLKETARRIREERLQHEEKMYALQKEFEQYKAQKASVDNGSASQINQMKDVLRRQSSDIGNLKDRLVSTQYQLAVRQQQLLAKDKAISEMRQTIALMENKVVDWQAKVQQRKDQQAAGSVPGDSKAQQEQVLFIKRQDKQIMDLKERLISARRELDDLKKVGSGESAQKIAALREQLQDIQLQLNQKDQALARKESEFAEMDERMKDNHNRLELVERVLEEKDQQIKELEKQLSEVITRFDK